MDGAIKAALNDVRDALLAGEDPDAALGDAAAEHGVGEHKLRNRAGTAFGDLTTYRERRAAIDKHSRETREARSEREFQAAKRHWEWMVGLRDSPDED